MKILKVLSLSFLLPHLLTCLITGGQPILVSQLYGQNLPAFQVLDAETTGIDFRNLAINLPDYHAINYANIYSGGGVAVGDINNDGWTDIFLAGNLVSNRLYLNTGEGMKFRDITKEAGLESDDWCTGAAMVDLNNDGWLDIYVCRSLNKDSTQVSNEIYFNNGDLTFTRKSEDIGLYSTEFTIHAGFLDYDLDGDLDIYAVNHPANIHETNEVQRNPTYGLAGILNEEQAQLQVSDRDYRMLRPNSEYLLPSGSDQFYENRGGTFVKVSTGAGLYKENGMGLGISVTDINYDGWPDIHVANDFAGQDFLYVNNRKGAFEDSVTRYFKHLAYFSMGSDVADLNNDGLMEMMIVDMLSDSNRREKMTYVKPPTRYHEKVFEMDGSLIPQYVKNVLYYRNPQGYFSEVANLMGVSRTDWSWTPLLADFDNDGLKDIFVTNGLKKDFNYLDVVHHLDNTIEAKKHPDQEHPIYKLYWENNLDPQLKSYRRILDRLPVPRLHNVMYRNRGGLAFEEVSEAWGLGEPFNSNGAAYADLDNDGDLDLVINNIDTTSFILKNNAQELNPQHYLRLRLKGRDGNTWGIGAKVALYSADGMQFLENTISRGFMSNSESILHFGLGNQTQVDSLVIYWPGNYVQKITDVGPIDRTLTIEEQSTHRIDRITFPTMPPLFEPVYDDGGLTDFVHQENESIDYNIQRLMPRKLDFHGPGLAVADVNGDGLEDVFVGGAFEQAGQLFLQQAGSQFRPAASQPWAEEKSREDLGALFFDVEGDGDLDLYIVSGGNQVAQDSTLYVDRLYLNDGSGQFTRTRMDLPDYSGSVVTAADFDQDGDLDVFVGGRCLPGRYPVPPRSFLLRNDGGQLVNVTRELAPGLERAGMVTAALWSDFNNDHLRDLIVVGEWMNIQFYLNTGTGFRQIEIPETGGWWNSILGADFDNDGDTDYILGNASANHFFRASEDEPFLIYADDYDENGQIDPIMFEYRQGDPCPVPSRKMLNEQIPMFNNRYPINRLYADATLNTLLDEKQRKQSLKYEVHTFETSYIENLGGKNFSIQPLPTEAQFGTAYGMLAQDVNQDGNLDILLAGNEMDLMPHYGACDGLNGLVLLGDGQGGFTPQGSRGFYVPWKVRALTTVHTPNGQLIIAANNDKPLQVFRATRNTDSPLRYIEVPADATHAELRLSSGKIRRHEIYHGAGYLSQGSNRIQLSPQVESVTFFRNGKQLQVKTLTGSAE